MYKEYSQHVSCYTNEQRIVYVCQCSCLSQEDFDASNVVGVLSSNKLSTVTWQMTAMLITC